ncbi:formate--tetrahydrofolate ligase [Yimella sp. cx-573]|nr:formate--tetrahydrofolate ligase [Yimella sp. cx-573]
MTQPNDVQIAAAAPMRPIEQVAAEAGIPADQLYRYGPHKAKVDQQYVASQPRRPGSKLVLVAATSPTPIGEGKTTTSVGLADGLAVLGERTAVCLREPSLGPVFGMKGGAAGGGYAQLNPMVDINLHFTGDFAAIAAAHNLLAAMLDNHLHQGNSLQVDPRRVTLKRVLDVNDRALRNIVIGLGGVANGVPREAGFDIVVASEVMAILCLAVSLDDLRSRLARMVVARTYDNSPVTAGELNADGAMTALLKDALSPNLVQTLEGNPAFVHGGPFANIAHGCNSVMATNAGLAHADWVITEAGFGADLGAEKFLDLKCRMTGVWPDVVVLVATIRSMKYHGGVAVPELGKENLEALDAGMANLYRHLDNLQGIFGLPVVVGINRFSTDTDQEIALMRTRLSERGVAVELATHFADGGKGATELARAVRDAVADNPDPEPSFAYADDSSLSEKVTAVAQRIYRADKVEIPASVAKQIALLESEGYAGLPVCIAKTQMSFAGDPGLRGAPTGHTLEVREVRLAAGAGFVIFVCGAIMTMPGLPKKPGAERISVNEDGQVVGLF